MHLERSYALLFVGTALWSSLALGCGSQTSAEQALNTALAENNISRRQVVPLGGSVLIDGQPPSLGKFEDLIVAIAEPNEANKGNAIRGWTRCDREGKFVFTTYVTGDGVQPGNYVVAFVILRGMTPGTYEGPDRLHNLYNDPAKSEFNIKHAPPGRADYVFDLQVAGREPVNEPGPNAIRETVLSRGRRPR